jgi:hypothetical protein
MALWKFYNLNKYGTVRSRIIPWPDNKPFSYNPKGFGWFQGAHRFKYDHEHMYPPAIFTSHIDGQKYIVPGWQKVHPDTQLSDINWIKPEVKKAEPEKNTWKFESSSAPGSFYFVRQTGTRLTCTCSGSWRAKDRRCKHIKEVEKCAK